MALGLPHVGTAVDALQQLLNAVVVLGSLLTHAYISRRAATDVVFAGGSMVLHVSGGVYGVLPIPSHVYVTAVLCVTLVSNQRAPPHTGLP
jgi:hypothetical protein